jgi:glutamyl-tRNA reductase
MSLLVCGINHHTAPVAIREQVAFPPEGIKETLQELLSVGAVNEAMILATCNRMEIIYTAGADNTLFAQWLSNHPRIAASLQPYWYFHQDQQAVLHVMRVASGVDSMVLGEPQILGQMKQAYRLACETGAIGQRLQRLFQTVFAVSKRVRTDTKIGKNPLSMGYAVVVLARRIFSDLSQRCVLLIGAGEIIELTAMHLYSQGVKRIIVASRSLAKAEKLAKRFFGHWISMADIPVYLREADIVVTATASDLPILGKGMVEKAIKMRKHRPVFMVDLAVPRDIEPEVGKLEDIYLYNIDDLESLIKDNRQCRAAAAEQAEAIIELQAAHFMRELQALDANTAICAYREKLQQLQEHELTKAMQKLAQGMEPGQVLTKLARNLTNKIMHNPCAELRKVAFDGRLDLLILARQLFDI